MTQEKKNKVKDFLYEEESYKIQGMFKESIVDNALTVALEKQGLIVESQKRIDVYFQGKKVGTYIPDKIVNGKILLEVKSKPGLTRQDVEQFWNYLKGSDYKLGFLINFGPDRLTIKRVVYDKARQR